MGSDLQGDLRDREIRERHYQKTLSFLIKGQEEHKEGQKPKKTQGLLEMGQTLWWRSFKWLDL